MVGNTREYIPSVTHYENLSMQYTDFFSAVKIENFIGKIIDVLNIFAQNIDFGYTLEPPQRGGSNEYPQSLFWIRNTKNRYNYVNPSFTNIKVVYEGVIHFTDMLS